MVRALMAIVAFVFAASRLQGQASGVPKAAEFDRNDRRAQQILASVRCAQSSSAAIRGGALGPVDSLGDQHLCVVQGGRRLVVVPRAD